MSIVERINKSIDWIKVEKENILSVLHNNEEAFVVVLDMEGTTWVVGYCDRVKSRHIYDVNPSESTLNEMISLVEKEIEQAKALKILSPNDIYLSKPVREGNLWDVCSPWHNNLHEFQDHECEQLCDRHLPGLEVKIHVDDYIDGERVRVVGSLWFNATPVMIFRYGGRGGHDWYDRFITNEAKFRELILRLKELIPKVGYEIQGLIDPDDPSLVLSEFYGSWIELDTSD